jgi:hypothetical protein
MRWTRAAPQGVRPARVRSSRVVLIPRRWDQVAREIALTTGASKPGTPGRARSSRKPIAQGMPVVPAHLYRLVGIFLSAHKACGCGQRPAFPAPSGFSRGTRFSAFARRASAGQAHHPGEMSRGIAEACPIVIARSESDEAIQSAPAERFLDCFASLAMTRW